MALVWPSGALLAFWCVCVPFSGALRTGQTVGFGGHWGREEESGQDR